MPNPEAAEATDQALIELFSANIEKVDTLLEDMAFNKALMAIWELISAGNKYIDETAPWSLAKDPEQRQRLGSVMYNLLESIRIIALLVAPFMPATGEKILDILGCDSKKLLLDGQDQWGGLKPGATIEKAAPIFPRIEN